MSGADEFFDDTSIPRLPDTTDLDFDVDAARVRKYNSYWRWEYLWFFISSGALLVLLPVIVWKYSTGNWLLATFLFLPVAFFARLFVPNLHNFRHRPEQMLMAFEAHLSPAVITKLSPLTIVALTDMRGDADEIRYGLQMVESVQLPGHKLEVGEWIPCSVTFHPGEDDEYWGDFEVHPLCWATPDQKVWQEAVKLIDPRLWRKLEAISDQAPDVENTTFIYDAEMDRIRD